MTYYPNYINPKNLQKQTTFKKFVIGFLLVTQSFLAMAQTNNPLICNPEEGICGTPQKDNSNSKAQLAQTEKPITIIYYTDPICSSCWGIEPQLRQLKLEYGDIVTINYHAGGLLPDWSYNSGGISKPSDVAHHWDEVSLYYDMPIDGDVWLENPLHSSYPPSIAFKAAQIQDTDKAITFLRELREMVFLQKKNITQWEHIAKAADKARLNITQLKQDIAGEAKELFENDLKLGKELGIRGFPTMIFTDAQGNREVVYGAKPYAYFEMAILKLNPKATKKEYKKDWQTLFDYYPTLTAREFSQLSGMPRNNSEALLNQLTQQGFLEKYTTKNGAIWRKK